MLKNENSHFEKFNETLTNALTNNHWKRKPDYCFAGNILNTHCQIALEHSRYVYRWWNRELGPHFFLKVGIGHSAFFLRVAFFWDIWSLWRTNFRCF